MAQTSFIASFAGRFKATGYAFGCANGGAEALMVHNVPIAASTTTLTVAFGYTDVLGTNFYPLATNAPISVGADSNVEIVTPSAVSAATPGYGAMNFTATFADAHGEGDPISSATFGLQEAINAANAAGGGMVVIDAAWYTMGGTVAIIQAASLPTNGTVQIEDISGSPTLRWTNSGNSLTVLAAPSAATSATVASQVGVVGTWTAVTEHVLFTYVNADGGETLASADYSFTATVSLAIGGSGPAALAGAVGYRVYIGTNATTSCYLVPAIAANGTVIQCGPIAAFKIGTPFSVATATTNAGGNPPLVQSTAFGAVTPFPVASPSMAQSFQSVVGPFAATGTVTAGTAIEWGKVQLPTGFLNYLNRTIRLNLFGYYTPVSTATLIITVAIQSVYGVTSTTVFTVTTPASSGTTAANINGEITIVTAATGATGTVECHGYLIYGGATGTAGLLVAAGDSVQAASSAIDLTKQDTIVISINSGTANLTTSQLRKLVVEVLA